VVKFPAAKVVSPPQSCNTYFLGFVAIPHPFSSSLYMILVRRQRTMKMIVEIEKRPGAFSWAFPINSVKSLN
jgi:hypothetical protein